MGFNCGIVGLPNVGKSTLFNALTQTIAAQAANFPFCTIEPNTGRVAVPDARLEKLKEIVSPKMVTPTQLEFVDIAGLVKGASKGEGLGNQFLANIREVDAIIHVLRCFEDDNITHVEGCVDPIRDAEIVETELMIADLESLEKRFDQAQKKAKGGDKEAIVNVAVMGPVIDALKAGKPARVAAPDAANKDAAKAYKMLQLLTAKPVLYVCNVDEDSAASGNAFSEKVFEKAKAEGASAVIISAAIESEVAQLESEDEKKEFLSALGLEETACQKSFEPDTTCSDCRRILPPVPKKCAPGPLLKVRRLRNVPVLFILILNAVLFAPRLLRMTTLSNSAVSKLAKKPEKCVPKEKIISCKTAICLIFFSTSKSVIGFFLKYFFSQKVDNKSRM